MEITLKRFLWTAQLTGGVFCSDTDNPIVLSGERPRIGDHPCIPAKLYKCHLQMHVQEDGKSYPSYQVDDVSGKTDIEIHIGNAPVRIMTTGKPESLGCIFTGHQFGTVEGFDAVLHSKNAYDEFMDFLDGALEFDLRIIDMVAG